MMPIMICLSPELAPSRHPRGFTLLEMVVAIVVLGILGAMAVPGMGALVRRAAVDEATRYAADYDHTARAIAAADAGAAANPRKVIYLQAAADGFHPNVVMVGIEDTGGDGIDDDGQVQLDLTTNVFTSVCILMRTSATLPAVRTEGPCS